MPKFPRWTEESPLHNLREVVPGLYVGAMMSPSFRPNGCEWDLVVDFYGSSSIVEQQGIYGKTFLIQAPFDDGLAFPDGVLDKIESYYRDAVQRAETRPARVLFHCQAGVSRSASAAYAMLRVVHGLTSRESLRRVFVMEGFPRKKTLDSAAEWANRAIHQG